MLIKLCLFIFPFLNIKFLQAQKSSGRLPIIIKDVGVVELKKGDVAMIFYVTVTNIGHQPIRLAVNGKVCCQTITKYDVDCESIKLFGGDMGILFPQDNRNLTLLYANLYPHNRLGSCEVEITDDKGGRIMPQSISFNTTLVKGHKVHVPRLLEQYYDPDDIVDCDSVDKDPLNACQPYICDIRYDGVRSLYNYKTNRCEKIPRCLGDPKRKDDLVAYNVETNTCTRLMTAMTERDFAGFRDGKPSVHTLAHEHGYPINVRCHNGKADPKGHWCKCNDGWRSSPFDHKNFNPDIQVYHMCTVWTGEMEADQAKNITVRPKDHHKATTIMIFSFLGVSFLFLLPILGYLLYRLGLNRRLARVLDQSETAPLTRNMDAKFTYESDN